MKKLIALLVIGGMFVFVSMQCALTNNNYPVQQSKIEFDTTPPKVDVKLPENKSTKIEQASIQENKEAETGQSAQNNDVFKTDFSD
mgnify:CR=1 FL=1